MAYYNWILAFHVMSFVSWMAMLFYLPRLFIYHRDVLQLDIGISCDEFRKLDGDALLSAEALYLP